MLCQLSNRIVDENFIKFLNFFIKLEIINKT